MKAPATPPEGDRKRRRPQHFAKEIEMQCCPCFVAVFVDFEHIFTNILTINNPY